MEIVNIEAHTWQAMMASFDQVATRMESLFQMCEDKASQQWLNSQELCLTLNISKRTLQSYRDSGKLAYTQINHKTYYKPEDVAILLTAQK